MKIIIRLSHLMQIYNNIALYDIITKSCTSFYIIIIYTLVFDT